MGWDVTQGLLESSSPSDAWSNGRVIVMAEVYAYHACLFLGPIYRDHVYIRHPLDLFMR